MSSHVGKHHLRGISLHRGNLEVLHPGSHWADRDQQVLGPSRQVLGAELGVGESGREKCCKQCVARTGKTFADTTKRSSFDLLQLSK